MLIINGSFLCRNLTGIERFSWELCKKLDKLISKDQIEIYIPKNAKVFPEFTNIKQTVSNKECTSFPLWDHFLFPAYLRKKHSYSLDFANITPLFRPGYVFIHDIYAKLYPQDFTSFRDKLIRKYMCFMYRHACKHGKLIFTVSEFSKKQIVQTYHVKPEKIFVINNGWDHFEAVVPDNTIFEKFPELKSGEYFFTLGSLQKRKNLKWIAENAANNPDQIYAISGKAISGMVSDSIKSLQSLKNVILLGYVTDEEVKALMSKCKAFIFPSYYEGFGIPPLEALSVGARIVVSDIECFKEIYRKSAYFINPENPSVNINHLLESEVESPETVLETYTYDKAAKIMYNILINLKS